MHKTQRQRGTETPNTKALTKKNPLQNPLRISVGFWALCVSFRLFLCFYVYLDALRFVAICRHCASCPVPFASCLHIH